MLYLGLWAGMLKNYYNICNPRPPICLTAKFRAKIRILKFGIKIPLFGCFGQQFLKNQCPRICHVAKFSAKIKILKFGIKNA